MKELFTNERMEAYCRKDRLLRKKTGLSYLKSADCIKKKQLIKNFLS